MAKFKNITGKQFGRLAVLRRVQNDKHQRPQWECLCECGSVIITSGNRLRRGRTRSCGCLQIDVVTRHGEFSRGGWTPELRAYHDAKNRCNNPNHSYYRRYGGRGIEFRFQSFEEFLKDVGRRPASGYSIDRINNDGHYEAGNLRWATPKEQAQNRRPQRKKNPHGADLDF